MPTLTPSPMPHIYLDERERAWIDDTQMEVIEVVAHVAGLRWTEKEFYERYNRSVSLAQIHAALAYYYDHQAAFDAEMSQRSESE